MTLPNRPAHGRHMSDEKHKATVREGMEQRRKRLEAGPSQVEDWKRTGHVAPALKPILDARSRQYRQMVEDSGGVTEVSAMKRALLDTWIQAQSAADVEFQRLLRNPEKEIPERLTTCLNTARAALVALGLERSAKPVPDLSSYLAEKAVQADAESTNGVASEDESLADEERGGNSDVESHPMKVSHA